MDLKATWMQTASGHLLLQAWFCGHGQLGGGVEGWGGWDLVSFPRGLVPDIPLSSFTAS